MNEYFVTADGQKFYTLNAAANHARTLEDKVVETITRDEDHEEEAIDALEIVLEDVNAPVAPIVEEEDFEEEVTAEVTSKEVIETETPVVAEVAVEEVVETETPVFEEVKAKEVKPAAKKATKSKK